MQKHFLTFQNYSKTMQNHFSTFQYYSKTMQKQFLTFPKLFKLLKNYAKPFLNYSKSLHYLGTFQTTHATSELKVTCMTASNRVHAVKNLDIFVYFWKKLFWNHNCKFYFLKCGLKLLYFCRKFPGSAEASVRFGFWSGSVRFGRTTKSQVRSCTRAKPRPV